MAALAFVAGAGRRRRLPRAAILIAGLAAIVLLLLISVIGAIFGVQPLQGGYGPSATARAEIPAAYLALYEQAGARYGIDPWILAAIGAVETDHGRSTAPGVHTGVNAYGCCAGPMQFSVLGARSTWDTYRLDGDHDGRSPRLSRAAALPARAPP